MSKTFDLDIPRMGYIIAVRYERKKKFNIFSEGIYQKQLWEGFRNEDALYTHVAISSGGQHFVNVTPPKAKLADLMKVYEGAYVKFLKYNGENFDRYMRYKIACIYNALATNLKYDWRGVIHFIIPRIKHKKDKFFCSEVISQTYKTFYPDFLRGIPAYEAMPAHVITDKGFEVAWEGVITRPGYKR